MLKYLYLRILFTHYTRLNSLLIFANLALVKVVCACFITTTRIQGDIAECWPIFRSLLAVRSFAVLPLMLMLMLVQVNGPSNSHYQPLTKYSTVGVGISKDFTIRYASRYMGHNTIISRYIVIRGILQYIVIFHIVH